MTLKLLPAFIWLLIITLLSTKGGVSMPSFKMIELDKVSHAAAYALLVWLILFGWSRFRPGSIGLGLGFLVVVLASTYGAFMELVQYTWFPNRHFELDDMLANAIGAFAGWLGFKYLARRTPWFS
jgi:VanZ family protein